MANRGNPRTELRAPASRMGGHDFSAETVAAKIGLPPEQLLTPLAVRGDRNGIALAVIPANTELDFKPSHTAPETARSASEDYIRAVKVRVWPIVKPV
jgi:prolyl-tRNA editing enzyme YbaK/EbsC (Cys-tRNA(Pro) deacylase)